MKKNILFIVAALFLFLGNQSVSAQVKMKKDTQSISTVKSEAKAEKMTTSLVRSLKLNKKQQEQVYNLFVKAEGKMNRASAVGDAKSLEVKQSKMDKFVKGSMKQILTEEQFEKYLELAKDL